MRKFLSAALISFLAVFLSAQFPTVEHPFLTHKNFLKNPGFEFGLSSWTKTGASTLVLDTTTPMDGSASATWNPSAAGEFLRHSSIVVPIAYRGMACRLKFKYSWDTGTAGHITAKVDDGTNDLFTAVSLNPTSNSATGQFTAGFVCPGPNSATPIRLTLASTADAAAIELENFWLGPDPDRGVLGDSSEFLGSVKNPGGSGCQPARSGTTAVGVLTGMAACPANQNVLGPFGGAVVSLTDIDDVDLVYTSLPAGRIKVEVAFNSRGSAATDNQWAITDGTSTRGTQTNTYPNATDGHSMFLSADFEYTTTGPRTFQIVCANSIGATCVMDVDGSEGTGNTTQGVVYWSVYRFPNQSPRDTVTLETQGFNIQAEIAGSGGWNLTTGTVSSQVAPSNVTGSLTASAGSFPVGVSCTLTNDNTVGSTTCSAGDEQPGIVFNAPYSGLYQVCVGLTHLLEVNTTTDTLNTTFYIARTANGSQTALEYGVAARTTRLRGSAASNHEMSVPVYECSNMALTPGKTTLRLMYTQASTGADTSLLNNNVVFNVTPLTQNFPQGIALNNIETGAGAGGCTKGNLCSGTYTPTSAILNNMTSAGTGNVGANWMRVGDVVHVAAQIAAVDPEDTTGNVAGSIKRLSLTLPIPPNAGTFSGTNFASGVCAQEAATGAAEDNMVWLVYSTNGAATVSIEAFAGTAGTRRGALTMGCTFQYRVQ